MNSWTVPPDQRAIRLDAFVRRCLPHLSLREVRRAIEDRAFWINGRPGQKGDRLCSGDVLLLKGSRDLLASRPLSASDLNVPLLYEDEFVLVADKPAGMPTHGFSGRETKSLANFVIAIRPSLCRVGKSRWEPGLVHRLDQETSGLVLVAKDQGSFVDLRSQFRRGLIKKRYWALVWGETKEKGIIDYPLIHDRKDRRKMKVVGEEWGKENRARRWKSSTRFHLLGQSQGFSLLEVEMETGVTHQIRVHLAAIGHPLIGDWLYGKDRPDPFGLERHFLHAFYLEFRHPKSGRNVAVRSPLPEELRKVLDRLNITL